MNIKSHGTWAGYAPGTPIANAPPNTLYARRASDGADWYAYVHSGKNFAESSVKLTVHDGVVGTAATDPTMLFPAGATLLEISDVSAPDPQAFFGGKVYNEGKKTFSDPPPPPPPPGLADILKRLEALEGKKP